MSTENKPGELFEGPVPDQVSIDYIKSNHFRVIHADGAWGGLTARNTIHMALFSERPTIPQKHVYKVTPEGTLGQEVREKRQKRDADLVREIEVDVMMSYDVAHALYKWLGANLRIVGKIPSVNGDEEDSR